MEFLERISLGSMSTSSVVVDSKRLSLRLLVLFTAAMTCGSYRVLRLGILRRLNLLYACCGTIAVAAAKSDSYTQSDGVQFLR